MIISVTDNKIGTSQLLFSEAEAMGLQPAWLAQSGGSFVISTNKGLKYVNGGYSALNSHVSASLSKNKYLTRIILGRHGFLNIPYLRTADLKEANRFLAKHKKIVVKPLKGMGAKDINIVTEPTQLLRLDITNYIFEKYIAGREMRYLVINDEVVAVHQSEYGESVKSTRDLKRISYAQKDWNSELYIQAVAIAKIFDLGFAAVDFMVASDGQAYILEVNSAPGLKWFHAPTSGPPVDVARLFLGALIA